MVTMADDNDEISEEPHASPNPTPLEGERGKWVGRRSRSVIAVNIGWKSGLRLRCMWMVRLGSHLAKRNIREGMGEYRCEQGDILLPAERLLSK